MTMRRRRRTSRSFRGTRRPTTWEQIPNKFLITAVGQSKILDLSNSQIINNLTSGGTCLRIIGSITVEHAAAAQALENVDMGFGICVITKDALAAGETPDPIGAVDQNQDWYWWHTFNHEVGPAGTDEGLIKIPIDIRTSRRLRGGYRLALITQKTTTELGQDVVVSLRLLWALQA